MARDPVCGMEVDERKARSITYRGKNYYFCSTICKGKFERTLANLKKAGGGICFGVIVEEEKKLKE